MSCSYQSSSANKSKCERRRRSQQKEEHTKHFISQSLYDEIVLENQDLFDLSPYNAIIETKSQLEAKGIDLSHLSTFHPHTDEGRADRRERELFDSWLESLDESVRVDGTIDLGRGEDEQQQRQQQQQQQQEQEDVSEEAASEAIVRALDGIASCCRSCGAGPSVELTGSGGGGEEEGHDDDNDEKDGTSRPVDPGRGGDPEDNHDNDDEHAHANAHEHEAPLKGTKATDTIDATHAEGSAPVVASSPSPDRRALAYLAALDRSQSMYTFMSLLSVVPLPLDGRRAMRDAAADDVPSSSTTTTTDTTTTAERTRRREQERVLQATCRCLVSILGPCAPCRLGSETATATARNLRSSLRDSFVAFERLVGLIHLYADRLLLKIHAVGSREHKNVANDDDDHHHHDDDDDDDDDDEKDEETLIDLLRLASATCRNCEANKSSFVRAVGGSRNGGAAAALKCLSLPPPLLFQPHRMTNSHSLRLTTATETCRLVSILCRFDDFRSAGGGNNGDDNGGSGIALPAGTSAHDRAVEFYRAGAISALRKLADAALPVTTTMTVAELGSNEKQSEGEEKEEKQGKELDRRMDLASAVLSAARFLAVNDNVVQDLVAVGFLDVSRRALRAGIDAASFSSSSNSNHSTATVATSGDDVSPNEGKNKIGTKETINAERRRRHWHASALTASALGLVRNLCGNDDVKTTLCLGSSDHGQERHDPPSLSASSSSAAALPAILDAMYTYRQTAHVQEHGLGTLAAMALRRPMNAMRIVELGGPNIMLRAMRAHPNHVPIQRQGSLAIRNVASRLVARNADGDAEGVQGKHDGGGGGGPVTHTSLDVKEVFLELGTESVLRTIAGRHQGSVDEAYAALRDLGCSVSLVKIDAEALASASVVPSRTVMFGDVKPRFNPVFGQSEELGDGGMEGRIARHVEG